MAEKLKIPVRVHEGRRITDFENLQITVMVYAGWINKNIVAILQNLGVNALGITVADMNLIRSTKRPVKSIDYGYVGDIQQINKESIQNLIEAPILPVFSPITHDGQGQLLNTNADTIASELAVALSDAYKVQLIYCFEKKGVLLDVQDENSLLPQLDFKTFELLKQEGKIHSGMIPKLDNAFKAKHAGVESLWIMNESALIQDAFVGTQLKD